MRKCQALFVDRHGHLLGMGLGQDLTTLGLNILLCQMGTYNLWDDSLPHGMTVDIQCHCTLKDQEHMHVTCQAAISEGHLVAGFLGFLYCMRVWNLSQKAISPTVLQLPSLGESPEVFCYNTILLKNLLKIHTPITQTSGKF